MKKVFLIRHAKAEEGSFLKNDFLRNLSPKGEVGAAKKALLLKELTPSIDFIISSDANRALQTAEIFANFFEYGTECIVIEHYLYKDYEPEDLLQTINQISDEMESVMIFGHNPNIAYAAIALGNKHISEFPTSCVAAITFEENSWKDISLSSGKLLYLLND